MIEFARISAHHLGPKNIRRFLLRRVEVQGIYTEKNTLWMPAIVDLQNGKTSSDLFSVDTGSPWTFIAPKIAEELDLIFDPQKTESRTFMFGNNWQGEDINCMQVEASLWFAGKSRTKRNKPVYVKVPVQLNVFDPEYYKTSEFFQRMPSIIGIDVMTRFNTTRIYKGNVTFSTNEFPNENLGFSTKTP